MRVVCFGSTRFVLLAWHVKLEKRCDLFSAFTVNLKSGKNQVFFHPSWKKRSLKFEKRKKKLLLLDDISPVAHERFIIFELAIDIPLDAWFGLSWNKVISRIKHLFQARAFNLMYLLILYPCIFFKTRKIRFKKLIVRTKSASESVIPVINLIKTLTRGCPGV